MREIIDDMIRQRGCKIDETMASFSDPELQPNARVLADGFLPVNRVKKNVYIAYMPVTNKEHNLFFNETNKKRHNNGDTNAPYE